MSSLSGAAFSGDGEEVIARKIQVKSSCDRREKTEEDLRSYYDIEHCVAFITENSYHWVALQFPDWLLHDAAKVATVLTEETSQTIFVLADTSYGSCCVDEIAAEHNGADCIIHFGSSCLTRTRRLPVLFVFGKEEVDVEDCERAFRETFVAEDEHILVLYDTLYSHCINELTLSLAPDYKNCVVSQLTIPSVKSSELQHGSCSNQPARDSLQTTPDYGQCMASCACHGNRHANCKGQGIDMQPPADYSQSAPRHEDTVTDNIDGVSEKLKEVIVSEDIQPSYSYDRFGRHFQLLSAVENYKVFYIGTEGPTLTNLIVNYSHCQFFSYNPTMKTNRKETFNVNKALGRRYFLVQKAKEARTVGILVGTLGAASYLEIIERLKVVLKQAGKKYYTVAVGKLNVPKMANFLEIDLFVLVACPENSLIDSQEFFKPVVTPYEMEIACLRSKEWTGDYSTDYQELLPGAAFYTRLEEEEAVEEVEPEFSLITGGFVPTKESSQSEEGHRLSVMPRSKMEVSLSNSAASYLQERSWQGLEQKLGESEVSEAVVGRTGIPTAYSHEQNS